MTENSFWPSKFGKRFAGQIFAIAEIPVLEKARGPIQSRDSTTFSYLSLANCDTTTMTERKRIAVVGSGAAGMMSAWSLNRRPENDVYLYEKNDYIGGHTNTVTVDYTDNNGQKKQVPIDTGFIVFNTLNYPNLVNFFKEVGVETVASDMSFALSLRVRKFIKDF